MDQLRRKHVAGRQTKSLTEEDWPLQLSTGNLPAEGPERLIMSRLGYHAMNPAVRVLYVEEATSVPSEYILPRLSRRTRLTLVTSAAVIPPGSYERVITLPQPRYPLQHIRLLTSTVNAILRKYPIDIIHAHASVNAFLRTSVPVVAHNHGSWAVGRSLLVSQGGTFARIRSVPGYFHYVLPELLAIRRASHVLVPSESLAAEIVRMYGVDRQRVTVVPNCLPDELLDFPMAREDRRPIRLLYAGRLHPLKGIDEFAKLFAESTIPAELLIVGDGPTRSRIQVVADHDSRVRLLGWLPRRKLYEVMRTTSVFVFPSRYESFGLALLEAMGAGHACVALKIPSMVEVAGDAAFLCESISDMVDAVSELVANEALRSSLQRKAWERSRRFSCEVSVERILDAYGTVLSSAAGTSACRDNLV